MALDKAIKAGKEKRTQYRKSKLIDASCRNNGRCPRCKQNRLYSNNKRAAGYSQMEKDQKEDEI